MRRLLLPLLLITAISSCKKSESGYPEGWSDYTNGPDLTFAHGELPVSTQEFTLANGSSTIVTQAGIRFTIPDSIFTSDNLAIANDNVKISVSEFFTNKDLFNARIETNLRVTGGAFIMRATTLNDHDVLFRTKPINVSIPEKNSNFSNDFTVRQGAIALTATNVGINFSGFLSWFEPNPKVPWQKGFIGSTATYNFNINRDGYWGLFRSAGTNQNATVRVILPAGYGNINTKCYLLLPENGMSAFHDDISSTSFVISGIAAGKPVKIFTIANKDGKYAYDLRSYTPAGTDTITINTLSPTTVPALTSVIEHDLN